MFRNIRAAVCLRAQEAEGRAVPGQPCEQNEGSEIDADPQDQLCAGYSSIATPALSSPLLPLIPTIPQRASSRSCDHVTVPFCVCANVHVNISEQRVYKDSANLEPGNSPPSHHCCLPRPRCQTSATGHQCHWHWCPVVRGGLLSPVYTADTDKQDSFQLHPFRYFLFVYLEIKILFVRFHLSQQPTLFPVLLLSVS